VAAPDGGTLSPDSRTVTIPSAAVTDSLVVELPGGVLTIAFSGNPIPAGGLEFHAGDPASGLPGGTLVLEKGTSSGLFETILHTLVNASDGSILLDPQGVGGASASVITYTGLEPIDDNLDADHRVFSFTGDTETITLSDAVGATGMSLIDSTLGESVTFANPTVSLTIDTTAGIGADSIYVEGLDAAFNADLFILADSDDSVHFRTNPTDVGSGDLRVTAGNIYIAATVSTTGGARLESLASSTLAIALADGGQMAASGITLIADSIDLPFGTSVVVGAGTVVVRPQTPGTLIDLGGADSLAGSPLTLGLSALELARIQAGTLTIGSPDSGEMRLTAPLVRSDATNVTLVSDGAIVFDTGSIDTGGGSLVLDAGTVVQPLTHGTDATAGTVSFAEGAKLAIRIDGAEVDTGYSQLNVAGAVDLTGAVLEISGTHVPAVGDAFTIVNNASSDPVIGTFTGLLEGAVIPDFLGSGLIAKITYVGGDGNDVVLGVINGTQIDMTIVIEPSETDNKGEVAALPLSVDWVHEWQSFWVEIWVSTPATTNLGVAEAMVDLRYNSDYLTAQELVYGPAFTLAQTGQIDDPQGVVRQLGARTAWEDVGDDRYVLLARVRFVSTGDDQVPVDEAGRDIGPYDMQMALAGGQTILTVGGVAESTLGDSPRTELWAVVYDIDDNDRIDFGDLSFFAAAFGRTVGSSAEPPFVWWADFDKSGSVDFGDLAFFAPNFGKSRAAVQAGDQTLVFPTSFPEAWAAATGGGEGEGESPGWDAMATQGLTSAASSSSSGVDRVQKSPPAAELIMAVDDFHTASVQEQPLNVPLFAVPRRLAAVDVPSVESRATEFISSQRIHRRVYRSEPLEEMIRRLLDEAENRRVNEVAGLHDAVFTELRTGK
jgi:hypothetical protein